jgi:hypothetical protein|nr:MAG TPA: hypothetical protein [Caudoviricetes sp.]
MKFGFRTPSLKKRIAARTSWKRIVRHNMGAEKKEAASVAANQLNFQKREEYACIYHQK